MNYRRWYNKVSGRFRNELAEQTINVLDKALVLLIAAVYLFALAYLFFIHDPRFARVLIVPAITFCVVSGLRIWFNAQRPYELYDIDPIIVKNTTGKSFPSRHISSAVAIACALAYLHVDWGITAFACCCIVAFTRIVGGVHFPRDVAAGAAIALAIGVVGFVLIP